MGRFYQNPASREKGIRQTILEDFALGQALPLAIQVSSFVEDVLVGERARCPGRNSTGFLDQGFVSIRGQSHYWWRAVDQDGDVLDILPGPTSTKLCGGEIFAPPRKRFRRVRHLISRK
jgi:hypothetical protein